MVAVGIIIAESIDKLFHPVSVDGSAIAWTAGVGVVVNALTAWLFMKDKDKDLNVKGAYLHMAADALVSVGVVASGIIIMYTGWSIIDPIIGLGIAVIIIVLPGDYFMTVFDYRWMVFRWESILSRFSN